MQSRYLTLLRFVLDLQLAHCKLVLGLKTRHLLLHLVDIFFGSRLQLLDLMLAIGLNLCCDLTVALLNQFKLLLMVNCNLFHFDRVGRYK
jgi:hypothetical protein